MIRGLLKFFFLVFFWICAVAGFGVLSLAAVLYFVGSESFSPFTKASSQNTVLTLTLDGSYVEHEKTQGLESLVLGKNASLYDLTRSLYHAAHDPKIKGLLVRIGTPQLGAAQIQEVRDALLAFRKTGKPSWCYADSFGELSSGTGLYYLATGCEEIWLQPLGSVNLVGLSIGMPFAKEALDKLGVKPELVGKREYKSFAETFTHDTFSEPNREALQAIVDSILSQYVDGIATERKLAHDQVRHLIHNGPYLTQEAQGAKLVDAVNYYHDLQRMLQERFGETVSWRGINSYLETLPKGQKEGKIALIFGSGAIQRENKTPLLGESVIGVDATCKAFRHANADDNVKAIVYRINSQGGSPIASETIYNTIQSMREQTKKPVIISMSDAAASGGYWVAVAGSKIVAQPATLTGSIGVFGGKFMLSGLFEKLGIKWGHIATGENATMWSVAESYSPAQWIKLNAWIDQIYDVFTERVGSSRKMSTQQVEKVARGRVWTGEQALALGLVDQLGGLHTALDLAKKEVGLAQDAPVEIYPQPLTLLERVASLLDDTEDTSAAKSSIFAALIRPLQQIGGICALLLSSQALLHAPLGEVR